MRYEQFKNPPPAPQQQGLGAGAALIGGTALGAMTSGAGGAPECKSGDTSFYCNFVKGFNIFKMIIFILIILVVIWFIYKMMTAKKSGKGRK